MSCTHLDLYKSQLKQLKQELIQFISCYDLCCIIAAYSYTKCSNVIDSSDHNLTIADIESWIDKIHICQNGFWTTCPTHITAINTQMDVKMDPDVPRIIIKNLKNVSNGLIQMPNFWGFCNLSQKTFDLILTRLSMRFNIDPELSFQNGLGSNNWFVIDIDVNDKSIQNESLRGANINPKTCLQLELDVSRIGTYGNADFDYIIFKLNKFSIL